MIDSKAEIVILAILEFVGLMVALYGMYHHYFTSSTASGIFYCTVWYLFGGLCHLFGLVSLGVERFEDEAKGDSQAILQFHYMTGWLSLIIGYPLLVTYTWTKVYPTMAAYLHLALSVLPILTLLGRHSTGIVRTTQICTGLAAISHLLISYKAGESWGVYGAVAAAVNIIAFSTPTRHQIWEFSARELFIIGLVVTSVMMTLSIDNLDRPVYPLKKLF